MTFPHFFEQLMGEMDEGYLRAAILGIIDLPIDSDLDDVEFYEEEE